MQCLVLVSSHNFVLIEPCFAAKDVLFYPSCCENVHINSLHLFSQQQRGGRTHTDPKCALEKNGSGKRIRHVKVCAWERDVFSPANHHKSSLSHWFCLDFQTKARLRLCVTPCITRCTQKVRSWHSTLPLQISTFWAWYLIFIGK